MRLRLFFVALSFIFAAMSAQAEGFGGIEGLPQSNFLEPQDAFKVVAKVEDDTLKTAIILGDKIHAYTKDLRYEITEPKKVELTFPKLPSVKYEGDDVFYGTQTIDIPLKQLRDKGIDGDFTLAVHITGCSDAGICYNPQTRTFKLTMPSAPAVSEADAAEQQQLKELAEEEALERQAEAATVNAKAWEENDTQVSTQAAGSTPAEKPAGFFARLGKLAQEGNSARIAQALADEGVVFILLLFFLAGLLLALTPCILPMVPILSSIIVQQAGKQGEVSRSAAFSISLVYVAAMAATYALIGVIAGLLNFDLQAHFNNPWIMIPMGLLFVALAFSLFGYFDLGLPASWQSRLTGLSDNAQGKGWIGTAIMGSLSALIVGTCSAPVISGAILFISLTGKAMLGGMALFVMGVGAGVPLLLVGAGANKLIPKPGGWMERVSQAFGVMMLMMALYIIRGVISDGLFMFLMALLLIGTALYMDVFNLGTRQKMAKLINLLAFILLLYGSLLFVGALSGAHSIFDPLAPFKGGSSPATAQAAKPIDRAARQGWSYARLMEEVKKAGKPVIVDIGKANCTACTELEEITFPDPAVREAMKRFKFIQIDITKYTPEEAELLKQFHLFGAPHLLFFDSQGNPLPQKFLTGFVPPEKLVEHLKGIQ